ncbi:IS66-like element accessory protein TnpA [Sulfuritalea hydrogenivorans]|uniref:Transposase IS3/IS911 family protein n=1 Tax=Sulfuritalea hydrogenivorans sk43H TaxID=1223802 RepID=W0SGZ1_9PROT|nr:transposase [Sulfuritalea hydrogenivorans]BAO30025.1 transposase IS3/IS911 family protein [Sulfuritalea hydrogenivorans sk43H]
MHPKVAKPAARRTRRTHTPEFKAQVIEACLQPGISVAGVALANGLNANYLRRWVKEHREQTARNTVKGAVVVSRHVKPTALVPVTIEAPVARECGEIRIDLRRGATAVQMAWPATHAALLGGVLKDLLR